MSGPDVTHGPTMPVPIMRGPIVRGPTERVRRVRRRGAASPRGGRGVLAAAAFGAALPQAWFRPGLFIATGTTGPALAGVGGVTRFWSTTFTGTGSTWIDSSALLQRSLTSLVRTLAGDAPLAQRLWFTAVVAMCAATVAWLALAFVGRPMAVFVAGAIGVLNPFHLTTLPDLGPMICIAAISATLGAAVRLWRGEHVPAFVGVLIALWAAPLAADPALLLLFIGVALVALVVVLTSPAWLAAIRLAVAFVAGSVFWAVPLLLHVATGSPGLRAVDVTDPDLWTWTQRHSGVRNVVTLVASWTWGNPDLASGTARLARFPWAWLRWALPAAVLLCLAFTWRRRVTRWLGGAIAVFVVLAVGVNTPFRPVSSMLNDVVPGYWLFRQPMAKYGVLLVICFALALALGVDDAQRRWAGRVDDTDQPQTLPALLVLLGVAAVFSYPLLIGTVVPGARPYLPPARVALPAGWRSAGAALDALPGAGATLVLPLGDRVDRGTVWGFYGIDDLVARVSDRAALFLLPGGYYAPAGSSPDLMRAAETSLEHGDRGAFAGAMAALGARYLAIRTDTTTSYGRNHTFADAASLQSAARKMGLRTAGVFQYVELFAVPVADRFGAATETIGIVAAQGTTQDRADALASTLLEPDTVISDRPSSIDGGRGLAWAPGADETGFATEMLPGRYRTGAVPLGPSLWRASNRGLVVALDPADRAEVNGRSVLLHSSLRLSGKHTPFALLVHEPADTATGGSLIPVTGNPVVQAQAGASVTLLTAQSNAIDFSSPAVGDCTDGDGLPATASPGMQAAATLGGVTIVATQGSACVAVPVATPADVAGHRRWRLTASTGDAVAGAGHTCLWLPAPGRCADGSRVAISGTGIDTVIDAFEDDLSGARLLLVADHQGADGDPATAVQFSDVHLSPIAAEGSPVAFPAAASDPVDTIVGEQDRALSLSAGNGIGRLLGRFDLPGDDCNRYDDVPSNVHAISLPAEPAPALALSADRHSACVSAPVAVTAGLRDVTVSFGYTASGAGVGRVALVEVGSGRVVATERLDATSFWTAHAFHVVVPPAAEGGTDQYRLFLYADGPGPGAARHGVTARFRSIRVSPSPSFALVVLPAATGANGAASQVSVRGVDDRFVAMTADGDAVLVFHQAYATGWSLGGLPAGATAAHFEADGWANGWLVHGLDGRAVVLHVRYRDDELAALAVWSVLLVLLLALACTDWPRLWSHRVRA